jgi:hypothetical protein
MDFSLEHLVWLDGIQMMFTNERGGRGHIPEATPWEDLARPDHPPYPSSNIRKEDLLRLNRRDTTRHIEEFFLNIQKAAKNTPWQLSNEPNSVQGVLIEIVEQDAFVRIFGSGCLRSMELPWRAHVDLESLVVALAAIRHKADHGQYPDSLEQLVETGYLKRVPQDPYANGPLVYRRVGDNFLLYSCGADFDDDGGTPSKWGEGEQGGDQVFWPVSDPE